MRHLILSLFFSTAVFAQCPNGICPAQNVRVIPAQAIFQHYPVQQFQTPIQPTFVSPPVQIQTPAQPKTETKLKWFI